MYFDKGSKSMGDGELKLKSDLGILIACEGISASGKSMTISNIDNFLNKYGFDTKIVEWNSNKYIRKIVKKLYKKEMLTAKIYSIFQWTSFLIDYHVKIKPYLKKNYIVIADRYIYTALTRDKVNGVKKPIGKRIYNLIRKPDFIFYHTTPSQVCYERIKKRGKGLFYTNKRILSNKLLKNKDLYYLKKLEAEYKKILANPKISKDTNIYYTNGNSEELYSIINEYIIEKKLQAVNKSNENKAYGE